MANLWQECICDEPLPCSEEASNELSRLLRCVAYEDGEEIDNSQGFDIMFRSLERGAEIVMYAEEMCCVEELSDEFLVALGKVIGAAGKPFWGFSWANRSSRLIVGESGGGRFRIYPDGNIVFAHELWEVDKPKDSKTPLLDALAEAAQDPRFRQRVKNTIREIDLGEGGDQ